MNPYTKLFDNCLAKEKRNENAAKQTMLSSNWSYYTRELAVSPVVFERKITIVKISRC